MEYEEVEAVAETAVAVVENTDRALERQRERAEYAERDARKTALEYALRRFNGCYGGKSHSIGPERLVREAEAYYAFLTAGPRK